MGTSLVLLEQATACMDPKVQLVIGERKRKQGLCEPQFFVWGPTGEGVGPRSHGCVTH